MRDFTSELTAIPGVGEKTRLLRNLGSIQRVANASVAELSPFVGAKTAAEIIEHFSRQRALAGGNSGEADVAENEADLATNEAARKTSKLQRTLTLLRLNRSLLKRDSTTRKARPKICSQYALSII
jgi:hypothetical protein